MCVQKYTVAVRPYPVVFDVVDDELVDALYCDVKCRAVSVSYVVDGFAFGALATIRVAGDYHVVDPYLRWYDKGGQTHPGTPVRS